MYEGTYRQDGGGFAGGENNRSVQDIQNSLYIGGNEDPGRADGRREPSGRGGENIAGRTDRIRRGVEIGAGTFQAGNGCYIGSR